MPSQFIALRRQDCDRRNGTQGRSALIPLNFKCIMWQRDFADERNVTDLKIGGFLGLSWCLHSNHLKAGSFSETGKRDAGRRESQSMNGV